MNARKLVITGAAGFVGANLARYALKKGFEVHALVKKSTNLWRLNDVKNTMNFYYTDLSSLSALKKILQTINPNFIFHLASYGTYPDEKNGKQTLLSNIFGTYNLLEASKDINYRIFVNTGSSSEYGFKEKPMKEKDVLEPITFYGASKASATLLCSVFAHIYKKPIITLRLFSVYGPYEEPTRLIPTAIKSALTGQILNITSGRFMHDFVFVEDVVSAYFLALNQKHNGQILNIGSGKQYSNLEIAKIINKISKNRLGFKIGNFKKRYWDTNYWVADINKTQFILAWKPKYNLEQGLLKTYEWIQNNLVLYL